MYNARPLPRGPPVPAPEIRLVHVDDQREHRTMNLTDIAAMQMEDIDHSDNKFNFMPLCWTRMAPWDDLNEWRTEMQARRESSYMRRVGWRPDRRRHRRGDAVCNHRLRLPDSRGDESDPRSCWRAARRGRGAVLRDRADDPSGKRPIPPRAPRAPVPGTGPLSRRRRAACRTVRPAGPAGRST